MLIRTKTKDKPKTTMAEYEDMRKMSMELNRTFDESGFCEYVRQLRCKIDSVCQLLYNVSRKVVGSVANGIYLSDSGIDFLEIDQAGVKVGYNPQEACPDSSKPYLCLTRGPATPAGYTKLQIYLNGNNCQNIENTELQRYFQNEIEIFDPQTIFLTNRSLSPAHNSINIINIGLGLTLQISNDKTIDRVSAYESKIIPIDMNSWFKRTRLKHWPSKRTCDLFKSMGCCYVAVGHSKSPEQNLEWRISPTRQELYLMFNLNPTQFRCYILLEHIRNYIHLLCGNGISSYHCKTALFWTIENNENNIWQPKNLIECVLKCLKLLLVWIKEEKCPNYFIPTENMFETTEMHETQFETLQKVITSYFSICSQVLLPVITNFKTIKAIIQTTFVLKRYVCESTQSTSSLTDQEFQTFQRNIELIKTKPQNARIQELQDWVSPHKIDIDILLEMLEEKLRCLNRTFHLKSILESNMFTEKDITEHINDLSKNSYIDYEYCLKLASIAITRGAYSTCDVLLQNVNRMTKLDTYCECYVSFRKDEKQRQKYSNYKDLFFNNISKNIMLTGQCVNQLSISDVLGRFSFCLLFRENEVGIVFPPLHFEAHKTVGIPTKILSAMTYLKYDIIDIVSIHPTACLYFLQYKNSEMMNKNDDMCVALDKLEDMNLMCLQKRIYSHSDTTLNLLGHIYLTNGWYRLAVQCFRRSCQMKPPYYNAVKWHVMFMLFCNLSIPEKENK